MTIGYYYIVTWYIRDWNSNNSAWNSFLIWLHFSIFRNQTLPEVRRRTTDKRLRGSTLSSSKCLRLLSWLTGGGWYFRQLCDEDGFFFIPDSVLGTYVTNSWSVRKEAWVCSHVFYWIFLRFSFNSVSVCGLDCLGSVQTWRSQWFQTIY